MPSPRTDLQLALEIPELPLAANLDRFVAHKGPSSDPQETRLIEGARCALMQSASARIQPDVAVAYQLLMEQPRLASLADWWGVFAQRVPSPTPEGVWTSQPTPSEPTHALQTEDPNLTVQHSEGEGGRQLDEENPPWEEEYVDLLAQQQAVQARFASALTALHDMGLVTAGARRAEHVARTVFDAPLTGEL